MHRTYLTYSLICIFLIVLMACEDVIEIDLEETGQVLVVDAWVTNESSRQSIGLELSQTYFDNSPPLPITDASVHIVRDDGQQFEFLYGDEGTYQWTPGIGESLGNPGDQFTLSVEWSGTIYEANTTMQRVAVLDSIGQEYRENELFGDDGIYAQFYARDFPGTGDAYWIKTYKNGRYLNGSQELNLAYDAGFDAGTGIDGLVFIPPIRELINPLDEDLLVIPYVPGDTILVEIHSLSEEAFNFMEIARDQINNGDNGIFALPLANTRTNIVDPVNNKGVLGFFNVAALSSKTKIID